ncbi:MAG: DUF3025 domain-containing protein [Xanthomonadales bacterium]|nr:DUF3025 domain-containing protein [Xanthomonadales bacterium]
MATSPKCPHSLSDLGPPFRDLHALHGKLFRDGWPQPDRLNDLLWRFRLRVRGRPLRFRRDESGSTSARDYERQIFETGVVPTRPDSWHDLLNALIWATFPRTKAAINSGHVSDPVTANRSRRRDALTLLDECGVVIATAVPELAHLNATHRWRELFWDRRPLWWTRARPYLIGHGLLEQCLDPYLGLTGKVIYLSVAPGWFHLPLARQIALLDDRLAAETAHLREPSRLLPLPLLGIPGFDPQNERAEYYANRDYFRPARRITDSRA